jgi:hypothetical protein
MHMTKSGRRGRVVLIVLAVILLLTVAARAAYRVALPMAYSCSDDAKARLDDLREKIDSSSDWIGRAQVSYDCDDSGSAGVDAVSALRAPTVVANARRAWGCLPTQRSGSTQHFRCRSDDLLFQLDILATPNAQMSQRPDARTYTTEIFAELVSRD